MFISVYSLDTTNPPVCRALLDAAEMHRQVQRMFDSARKDHAVLYRMDQGSLIVQSDIKPFNNGIFTLVLSVDMSEKTSKWATGKLLRFRLKTVPRKSDHGKKHYIKDSASRVDWVVAQLAKRGAQVTSLKEVSKENITVSSKVNSQTGGDVAISTWEYEGSLKITDIATFLKGYKQGIGAHKAYGCGMICFCG